MYLAILLSIVVGASAAGTLHECGRVVPQGESLVLDGRPAGGVGHLPWHTAVYSKNMAPYQMICGGSLISNNIVLAGATCFWRDHEKLLPASQFAVAAGKTYRPWSDPGDYEAQKSDVKEIHIPPTFQGSNTNFQDDIAVVILTNAFEYKIHVRPICLNFDANLDREQLQEGKKGKVASWGGQRVLGVVELAYVGIENCITESVPHFRPYITSDKMCAKSDSSNFVCRGDSGNGIAFSAMEQGVERFYLRGIVSVAPVTEDGGLCHNKTTIIALTHILKHEGLIKKYWSES